jgi:hypothetical protein
MYEKQPIDGGEAIVDGPSVRCFNGQRMDFELVATRESGSMGLDWFGMSHGYFLFVPMKIKALIPRFI